MDQNPDDPSADDTTVEDVLAAFNAEELVEEPVNTASKHADDPAAATPDSPNPI